MKQKLIRHIIYGNSQYPKPQPAQHLESQVTSNLFLQKLLYFNGYFSGLFLYVELGVSIFKLWCIDRGQLSNAVALILLAIWAILEYFRISNGYSGNIKEQFPELFSFVLITIISTALEIAIVIIGPPTFFVEYGLISFMTAFTVFEFIAALYSMCQKNRSQVAFLSTRIQKSETDQLIKREIEDLKKRQRNMELELN